MARNMWLIAVVLCTIAVGASAADGFVGGAKASSFYDDGGDTLKLKAASFCGHVGYAFNSWYTCPDSPTHEYDASNEASFGLANQPEVGWCQFSSTVDIFKLTSNVGADGFTGMCRLSSLSSCGEHWANGCEEATLYIQGTVFTVDNAVSPVNLQVPADTYMLPRRPGCDCLDADNCFGGARTTDQEDGKAERRAARGRGGNNDTPNNPASATKPAPLPANLASAKPAYAFDRMLPPTVYTGWAQLYSGYMFVVDNKTQRRIGEGPFNLWWPINTYDYEFRYRNNVVPWTIKTSSVTPDQPIIWEPYTLVASIVDEHGRYASMQTKA